MNNRNLLTCDAVYANSLQLKNGLPLEKLSATAKNDTGAPHFPPDMHICLDPEGEATVTRRPQKRYCKQCCREDVHKPVDCPIVPKMIFAVISLGLVVFFWPTKCTCCGTKRIM